MKKFALIVVVSMLLAGCNSNTLDPSGSIEMLNGKGQTVQVKYQGAGSKISFDSFNQMLSVCREKAMDKITVPTSFSPNQCIITRNKGEIEIMLSYYATAQAGNEGKMLVVLTFDSETYAFKEQKI